jgi:hypothetical protein
MLARRPFAAIAAASLVLVLLLPAIALAADAPDVTGTVTLGGKPVEGAAVSVTIAGTDMVWSAVTDAEGAFGITSGIAAGQTLTIGAMTPSSQSSPDKNGCVTVSAMSGRLSVAVDALPVAPVEVVLDQPVVSTVCSATASPRIGPTPPPTDAGTSTRTGGGTTPLLVAVGLAAVVVLALGPVRRSSRRR